MNCIWAHPGRDAGVYSAICDFVSSRIWGEARQFPAGTAMAVVDGDRVIAGVVYNNFEPQAGVVEMHGAAVTPKWLTRPVLREMFEYPFEQLGCQAVVMRVDPNNRRLGRILKAYGFERHDVPRLRGRDKPEAFYILGDDMWRANGFHRERS